MKAWIYQVDQFFDFYRVEDRQHITVSSFAMFGDAAEWFEWMHLNGHLSSWQYLLKALEVRFGPLEYVKLRQEGTVAKYQLELH